MTQPAVARLAPGASPDEVAAYAAVELAAFLDAEVNPGAVG
jgi:hypothetical protein